VSIVATVIASENDKFESDHVHRLILCAGYIHTYVLTHAYVIHKYIYTYIHTYTHTHTHTHTLTYTHTHTYVQTQTDIVVHCNSLALPPASRLSEQDWIIQSVGG
jgi:carbohydrate-binding DOMON domain-containing protein